MDYVFSILSQVCIFAISVAALDLLVGYAGILSFGHAAFIGIGAYTGALLLTELNFTPEIAVLASMGMSGGIALVLGLPTLRLSGDYFILATLGLSVVTSSLLENWISLTNGPFGIFGIPPISIFGFKAVTPINFFFTSATVLSSVLILKQLLVTSSFGLALRAVHQDETVASALGKNATQLRVLAFGIGGAAAGLAGVLTACNLRFIDPSLFQTNLTIFIWASLFVGGCGSWLGNLLGPLLLLCVPESLRFIGLEGTAVAHVRELLYGVVLIGLTMFRPQGIVGKIRIR
jgi:branched-chain amino acid transport system permease protein